MTSNDWQNRLLTDEELQRALASMGALEGMAVLQRQLEIRSQGHSNSGELRSEVSNALELGQTDIVPMVMGGSEINPVLAPAVVEPPVAPVAAPEVAPAKVSTDTDIVNNLNALFGAKPEASQPVQPVTPALPTPVVAAPAIEAPAVIAPAAPAAPVQPNDYAPKPVESGTASVFIPTFANPVPPAGTPVVRPTLEPMKSTAEIPVAPIIQAPVVEPAVSEWPVAETGVQMPSAEEAITAFEEANTVNAPMPHLVDEVILASGGESDSSEVAADSLPVLSIDVPIYAQEDASTLALIASENGASESANEPAPAKSESKTPGSGIGHLIATWNGTGSLLFLIASGFVAGMLKFSIITALAGAFGALAVTGLGLGTAAVTARRGRQPQATISRAVYGVRGAAIPLIFVTIARYAATAVAGIASVVAVSWYFPSLPKTISLGATSVDSFYLVLAGVFVLAALATTFSSGGRRVITQIVAYASFAWVGAAIALAAFLNPGSLTLGQLDPVGALAFASALLIFVSLIWGTTAADETPNLRSNIHSVKLIAAGLLTNSIFGSLAVLAGLLYFHLDLAAVKNPSMGVVLAIAVVLALSHQLRRTADSFSGFGLVGTRWWVVLGSLLIITGGIVSMHLFVEQSRLESAVLSLLPVAGVPVIAWLASYGVDAVMRRENYHEVSLLRDYGFYGKVRLANLIGWVLATAVGWGFVASDVPGFGWLGYLARPLNLSAMGVNADMGVWIAFVIAALAPLFTIGKIHNQEAEGRALAERHRELVDVLGEA